MKKETVERLTLYFLTNASTFENSDSTSLNAVLNCVNRLEQLVVYSLGLMASLIYAFSNCSRVLMMANKLA